MRNNHIALPLCPTNSTAVHCAVPIAPTSSVVTDIGVTCCLLDSLASKSLLAKARSRVSRRDTELAISANHLLTTTSNCWESHPTLKVIASVAILTYKAVLEARGFHPHFLMTYVREQPLLTPRQQEIANLATQGLDRRKIAIELFLSLPTIDSHLTNIYRVLKVKNFTQMVATLKRNPDILTKSSVTQFCVKSPISEAHRLKKQRLLAAQSLSDTLIIAKHLVAELEATLEILQP